MRAIASLVAALAVLLGPSVADAQPPTRVVRIGILSTVNPRSAPFFQAFEQRLGELGYIEGQNLTVDFRNAEGKVDRLPELAADLARSRVDVIVASGPQATVRAARQATDAIPIVVVAVDYDPLALGYVASLARPGGTVTGVFAQQPDLAAKRLELLKEALPKLGRVAVHWDVLSADQLPTVEAAARTLRVGLELLELKTLPYDYTNALESTMRTRAGAVLVLMSPIFFRDRGEILALAKKHRLPVSGGIRAFAEAGALMTYGVDLPDMFRRAATYVDKILKGVKPADLPVEQPTHWEMVINLKTAKALGLTIPQTLLLRADQVIE